MDRGTEWLANAVVDLVLPTLFCLMDIISTYFIKKKFYLLNIKNINTLSITTELKRYLK